ncbi:MAG: DUF1036 domain-containing protein [Maricaulaceae bacterium]
MKLSAFILALALSVSSHTSAQDTAQDTVLVETVAPAETPTYSAWKICNETSFILRMATAQTEGLVTHIEGWRRIRPSECVSETPRTNAARFLYAESAPVHNGGIREWDGQVPICVNPVEDFKIDGTVSCALQGLETRRFLKIDPEETVTKLIEPDNFGSKAEAAGIQRLLQDAGYKINRVDGISGRRTRNTLRSFLKEHGVESTATIYEKMEALAIAARETQESIGLTVCNDTKDQTWLALGYREDGSWQSRGWWSLNVGDCIRPWSKNLQGTEMHIYAQKNGQQENSEEESGEELSLQTLNVPAGVTSNFCIAEAKFSALGREYCADQGYVSDSFRPVMTDEKGLKLSLTESDFMAGASVALRQ